MGEETKKAQKTDFDGRSQQEVEIKRKVGRVTLKTAKKLGGSVDGDVAKYQAGRKGRESVCESVFFFGIQQVRTSAKNKELEQNLGLEENSQDWEKPPQGIGKGSIIPEGSSEPQSPELGNYKFVLKLQGGFLQQHLAAGWRREWVIVLT